MYLQHLFPVTTDQSVTIFTYSSNLFEIFGIISLLLFGLFSFFLWHSGFLSTRFTSWTTLQSLSFCSFIAIIATALPQLASLGNKQWLYYVASGLSGFFLSIPYSMMELLIMQECHHFRPSRVLGFASLNTQIAAAVAGYPVSLLFRSLCPFRLAPLLEASFVLLAVVCLRCVSLIHSMESKQKSD